jgi:hypothetical protein
MTEFYLPKPVVVMFGERAIKFRSRSQAAVALDCTPMKVSTAAYEGGCVNGHPIFNAKLWDGGDSKHCEEWNGQESLHGHANPCVDIDTSMVAGVVGGFKVKPKTVVKPKKQTAKVKGKPGHPGKSVIAVIGEHTVRYESVMEASRCLQIRRDVLTDVLKERRADYKGIQLYYQAVEA